MSATRETSIKKSNFFGWDLLYKTVENVVNKKEDVLIILLHFQLTKHSNFQCIGLGEDETILEDEDCNEMLPDGWNYDKNTYALRYICNGKLYLLYAEKTKHSFIITLLDPKAKGKKQNILLDADLVNKLKPNSTNLDNLVPTASDIVDRYCKELLQPFMLSSKEIFHVTKDEALQTNDEIKPKQKGIQEEDIKKEELRRQRRIFMDESFGISDFYSSDMTPEGRIGVGNVFAPARNRRQKGKFDPYNPFAQYDSFDFD